MELVPLAGKKEDKETDKAVNSCNDYLQLGSGRSLRKLLQIYLEGITRKPPTRHLKTLAKWSKKFHWVVRAQEYDAKIIDQKERLIEQKRLEVLEDGLALDYERVRKLKDLASYLWDEIQNPENVWLADVKKIGVGEDAERVDLVKFNASLIGEFRATLDDIAKEVGERVKPVADINIDNRKQELKIMYIDDWRNDIESNST